MTTVCVTGGLGFIGVPLCRALCASGYRVRCVDRLGGRYGAGRGPGAVAALEAAGVEVLARELCAPQLRGADAVVHLAALPGVRARRPVGQLWRENVELTRMVLDGAARSGARLVFASSSSIYGDAAVLPSPEHLRASPLGLYAASKLAAERSCLSAGRRGEAHALAVRLFTVFGPGQRPDMAVARWIEALVAGRALHWHPHRDGRREFTYVDDAVRGIVAALERGRAGEVYNVAGCGSHRLDHVLDRLEQLTGRRARRLFAPASGVEAVSTHACPVKAERELGYRPAVSLDEGLRAQVEALRLLRSRPRTRHVRQAGAAAPPRPAGARLAPPAA